MSAMRSKSVRRGEQAAEAGPRPFLKWAGGKRLLAPRILDLLPRDVVAGGPGSGRYLEPFLGGGAVFFALPRAAACRAALSDVNGELVDAFTAVRDEVEAVVEHLGRLAPGACDRDEFERVRATLPQDLPLAERAARTIYLNKTCFNGLFRVNSEGRFNVPFGDRRTPLVVDEDNLRACSRHLSGVTLRRLDFQEALALARRGDAAYLDPPYAPVSRTSNFTSFTRDGFDRTDQERLVAAMGRAAARGVRCLTSNSDVPLVRRICSEAALRGEPLFYLELDARRSVSASARGRGRARELLVANYPVEGGRAVEGVGGEGVGGEERAS
jgi:DNA adenine methylase